MRDALGRDVDYLRISVTDRCNYRCRYCMPLRATGFARSHELLTFAEIVEIARQANELGILKFRITGGEPLLRPGLTDLIRALRDNCRIDDLSMTTNGELLATHAHELAEAGLDRVNISVDTLQPRSARWLARGGDLQAVLRGIEAALDTGLHPVKLNTVVIAGVNDHEMEALIERFTLHRPIALRFIECMPIGEAAAVGLGFVDLTRRREQLAATLGLVAASTERGNGPARYWRVPGAVGTVGFITPISEKYCATCSRLRLDARGTVRPCLAFDLGVSLRDALRRQGRERVLELMRSMILNKPNEHHWELGRVTNVRMSSLGG